MEAFEHVLPDGEVIRGDVQGDGMTVVLVHGFKGFRRWGFFPHLASALAASGFRVITFDFSLNGISEDGENFTELEKFRKNTFTREVEELHQVLNRFSSFGPFHVVGHSRGAFAALIVGAERDDVSSIALLAPVSHPGPMLSEEQRRGWRKDGVLMVMNARTKQELPLGIELLDDMERHASTLEYSARGLAKPLLVVHGTADESVPVEHGKTIAAWTPRSELVLLEGANHAFGARHPLTEEPADLLKAEQAIISFFEERIDASSHHR